MTDFPLSKGALIKALRRIERRHSLGKLEVEMCELPSIKAYEECVRCEDPQCPRKMCFELVTVNHGPVGHESG